jgi:hypothetical protein
MVNVTTDKKGYTNLCDMKVVGIDNDGYHEYNISSFRKTKIHDGKYFNTWSFTRHIIRGPHNLNILAFERKHEDSNYSNNEVDFRIEIVKEPKKIVIPFGTYRENKDDTATLFIGRDNISEIGGILRLHEMVYLRREYNAIVEKKRFEADNSFIGTSYGSQSTQESEALLAKSREIDRRKEAAGYLYNVLRKVIDALAFQTVESYINTLKKDEP